MALRGVPVPPTSAALAEDPCSIRPSFSETPRPSGCSEAPRPSICSGTPRQSRASEPVARHRRTSQLAVKLGQRAIRPPGTRTLHKAPTALRERRVFSPPSLSSLLQTAGFEEEATRWFEQQDVADVTAASQLSHHEIEKIVADRATVGRVRLLHQLLSQQAQARASAHMDTLEPTASSVFGRSMLLMGASELKHANLTRLTSESVFASLMLTIAVGALIESPTADDCVTVGNFGPEACHRLLEAYVATFGTASAFFLGSCLVTLGAVNFFHNVATSETVHFVTVASELYSSSSFLFTALPASSKWPS